MDNKTKGKKGEDLAKSHYQALGFEILEENYRYKRCEIDLIALLKEELLVFIEVKNRSRSDFGNKWVALRKQQRITSML